MSDTHKATNIRLEEMTKKIQDHKMEIDKEIEVLKRAVIKMEWESLITHTENAEVSLASRINL